MRWFFTLMILTPCCLFAADTLHVSEQGYSITFPKDWETGRGFGAEDVYALAPVEGKDDQFHENITVIVDDAGNRTLDEFVNLNVNGLEVIAQDFQMVGQGDITINGMAAKYLIFTHRSGALNLEVVQYIMLDDHTIYAITATATTDQFEKYKPIFEKVAHSFKMTKESHKKEDKKDKKAA